MPRHFIITAAATASLVAPCPVQAQFVNYTPLQSLNICDNERVLHSRAPAQIESALTNYRGKLAFRVCTDEFNAGENTHYYLRVLTRHQNGVCEAKETEVFLGGVNDTLRIAVAGEPVVLHNLTGGVPMVWTALGYIPRSGTIAFATGEDCPSVDDTRYIITSNVPDGTLTEIQEFWRQAAISREAFNRALGNVTFQFQGYLPWIHEGQQAILNRFWQDVLAGKEPLHDISCDKNVCRVSVGGPNYWIDFAIESGGVRPVQWSGYLMA